MASKQVAAKPHNVYVKNKIRQVAQDKRSPKSLIRVFDSTESNEILGQRVKDKQSRKHVEEALNWSKFELSVKVLPVNPDFLRNCFSPPVELLLSSKVDVQYTKTSNVSDVKQMIEREIRNKMPQNVCCDLLEIRLGERLTLPTNANMSSLIKHSQAEVYAMIHLSSSASNIEKSEFTMKEAARLPDSSTASLTKKLISTSESRLESRQTIEEHELQTRIIQNQRSTILKVNPSPSVQSRLFQRMFKEKEAAKATLTSKGNSQHRSKYTLTKHSLSPGGSQQLKQGFITRSNFATKLDMQTQPSGGLKPGTSDQSLKSRKANILQKSREIFHQVDNEFNDYEPYGQEPTDHELDQEPQMSQRSYKSLTSRLFPKVSLSSKQQARIMAKIPRQGLLRTYDHQTEQVSRLTNTRDGKSGTEIQTLSPIPIRQPETMKTSTNFSTSKRRANILETISKLEDLGQVDPLKTFTNLDLRPNESRTFNAKTFDNVSSKFRTHEAYEFSGTEEWNAAPSRAQLILNQVSTSKLLRQQQPFLSFNKNQSCLLQRSSLHKNLRLTGSCEPNIEHSQSQMTKNKRLLLHQSVASREESGTRNGLKPSQGTQIRTQCFAEQSQLNSGVVSQDPDLRRQTAISAAACIASSAQQQIQGTKIEDQYAPETEDEVMTEECVGLECTQAVLLLDQMGLYALTEVVMDQQNYSNLLYLFLCPRLGPVNNPAASLAQRRILNKIVNTLTAAKANLIVSQSIGYLLVDKQRTLPSFLQQLITQLLQKATRMADFHSLSFDWLMRLISSRSFDLTQTALTVLLSHSDPSKNNKQNQQRLDWMSSVTREHLVTLEKYSDVEHKLECPDSIRFMAQQILVNFWKQSEEARELIKSLEISPLIEGEVLSRSSSKATLHYQLKTPSKAQTALERNVSAAATAGCSKAALRVLASKGVLKRNPRMLNSFMSLQSRPSPVNHQTDKQGLSTPQWNLRRVAEDRPRPVLKLFPAGTERQKVTSRF